MRHKKWARVSAFKHTILVSLTFAVLPSHGWEIDNVTCRYQDMQDSQSQINAETNRRIQEALKGANDPNFVPPERAPPKMIIGQAAGSGQSRDPASVVQKGKPPKNNKSRHRFDESDLNFGKTEGGCDEKTAIKAMEGALASAWFGSLESYVTSTSSLSKCEVDRKKSVYQDFSILDSRAMFLGNLNPVVQINGVKVGADKLAHFMTEGLQYYKNQRRGKDLKEILQQGIDEEEGGYGWDATSIKSYADMAANYQGYLFWRQVLEGDDPYLKCVNGNWVQNRDFQWEEFVNAGMDESVNCNQYRTESLGTKVDKRTEKIVRLNDSTAANVNCPLDPEGCREALTAIREPLAAAIVIHPRCRAAGERLMGTGTTSDQPATMDATDQQGVE